MGLYRRGKIYWFTIMEDGKRIQVSTRTENKKLAERIYAKAKIELIEGKWFENQNKKRSLKEMIERYKIEYTESKDYYQKARDKTIFNHLIAYFGENATLEDVEVKVGGFATWRLNQKTNRGKPPDPGTIRKELSLLRRMFNVAKKQWGWKIANPVSEIELPKDSKMRVRYLRIDERALLFKTIGNVKEKWLKPIVIIALETGLRLSNLCNLMWNEVNFFNKMIIIEAEKMKNASYLGIPLTEEAYNTLRELYKTRSISGYVFHDNGKKLYARKVQRAFKKVLKEAGIQDFRFHDQRHTFASYLRQLGVDLGTVAELLGHKDLRMTKRYSHLSVEFLRDAVSKLKLMPRIEKGIEEIKGKGVIVE